MTKVPQGFDFSFLNDEEARQILQVLERNEELQRAEKDRISKLQKTKRDIRWLQGVTGEWFEEIQRKKFRNDTDVNQMLKQPLTYRLRKAKNDAMHLPTSRSSNLPNRNNPSSARRPGFRSSLASLFSFRKSGKEILKPQTPSQGYDGFPRTSVTVKGTTGAGIYNSPLNTESSNTAFTPKPIGMREGSSMPPWDASQLENEFFQVLDDLDNKLAQEQALSPGNTRTPIHYGFRTQTSSYHTGSRNGNLMGRHGNNYGEISHPSIYDILRPSTPRQGFRTFSYRTKTIYDMYGTREYTVSQEEYKTFGSSSLCSDRTQPLASPTLGHFTANSLHLPSYSERKSVFLPRSHQQSPRRTPLSSIIWNRSYTPGDVQYQEEFLRAESPMEVDPVHQDAYPNQPQGNGRNKFYHFSNVYQSVRPHAPWDRTTSPESFENSENIPFHQHENKFSQSYYYNTTGPRRLQKFGESPFWNKKEEFPSLSDFHHRNKEFNSSNRDFEMISTDVNEVSAIYNDSIPVPSQPWRANFSRNKESIHREFNFQTCVSEDMEVLSQDNGTQVDLKEKYEHLPTPSMDTMGNKFWNAPDIYSRSQVKLDMLGSQQKWPPMEAKSNSKTNLPETTQNLASSVQIPHRTETFQHSDCQNAPTMSWDPKRDAPDESASFPLRSQKEFIETSGDSITVNRNQSNTWITELNPEKDLIKSMSEKMGHLNKVDETSQVDKTVPIVSQSTIMETTPDYQLSLSRDSTTLSSNKFVFNAPVSIVSKKPTGVFGKRDISKIYISNKDKANALKKEKDSTMERKPDSGTSFPFSQENRTTLSFPKQNQGFQQESAKNNVGISNIKNEDWKLETASNRNPQYKGDSFVLDANNMQGGQLKNALVPPTNCSRFAENHHGPSDHSPDLLPDDGQSLPSSFPVDSTSLASLVTPSGTSLNFTSNVLAKEEMFSKKSLLGKDASKRESEEKACSGNTDQNDQLTVSTSENQASGDIQVLDIHKLKDVAKCHPDHSFTLGREKGKIRRSLSYIEKLSKSGNFLRQASNDSNDIVPNQGNSQSLETLDIYCTFPRKLTSFLIDDNKKLENKIMSTSFRKGPPPFQIKNIKDPLEKCFSNKNNSNSSEPNRRCPEVNVNSSSLRSTPEEITTNIRNIAPASFRKGPPPFEIKGTRPFGTCSSDGVDRRDKYGLDTEPFILTPRPEELISTSQENSPSIKKHSLQLTKGHPHEESFQVHSENHSKMASSQKDNLANTFFLPDEKHLSSSPDMSEKQNGKPLHKYKTTSTVTISGDEDNVKRLEVVSIYYTLPRKHNKKLCDFLKSDTQSISLSPESTTVEDATFPISFSKKQLNSSAQSLPETPVSPYAKASVSRCQWRKHSFSQDTETGALFQSPHSPYPGAEKPSAETLQEMVGGISLCGECNPTKTPSAKTISGDLQSKSVDTFSFIPGHQQGQEKWQNHSRYASVSPTELHNKLVRERKLENPKQSIKVYERESPSVIQTHLRDASNSPCRREILEKCGPCNIDAMSIGSRNYSGEEVNDKMNLVSGAKSFYDNVRESQPDSADGKLKTDDQKIIEKTCSALQSKDFSLSSNSVKLQPEERNHKGQPDLERSLREPKEVPQEKDTDKRSNTEKGRLAEVEDAPNTKANEKMQGLPCDQHSPPKVIDEIKCNLDCTKEKTNLEKRKNRPSVKQKLAAMSKVSRKFSTKDMSSRRHIATIFPQEEVNSSTNSLPQNTPEMAPSSAKSTLGIPESTHESKKSGTSGSESIALPTAEVSKTENPLQPPLDSIQKPITYGSEQKTTTSSSKPQKNKLENVTESPSSSTNFENAILMERGKCPQRLKTEHETPTQPMISSPGTKDFSDDLKRLSLQFPSKAACKAPDKRILPPSTQPQQKNISLQEWEPDSNLYRSKSLKNINEPSNQPQISQTQKMRERHFSACTFSDNAPDRGKLGDEFPVRSGHGRRFRSFSELSACDEKDTWTLGSDRARASGPRATSSISRPIDYGIFGKEQQLAFLENVKRSLTEGRLWRPNFLKNPGFLTDDANHPADKPESLTSGKMSKDGLSPREVLNIYQDAPVVGHSGSDTDTTTDDEYYLDEADKESEL
ncbi:exophilin-5 isoform X2 [Monodelphis domestica]|uniref:exophilin-5 isoform X2 n=1 Tax=Monodelphis domestica TaxID=13616 RepID=UPI0024E22568|nr:exophilin-5 isoform X2 [Monodelphis domestica]